MGVALRAVAVAHAKLEDFHEVAVRPASMLKTKVAEARRMRRPSAMDRKGIARQDCDEASVP